MAHCPQRGRLISADRCYCRHPLVTGPRRKSTPVPLTRCETCPIPTGGELTQLTLPPAASIAPVPQALAGGPGTELVKLYQQRGIPGCQQCYGLAARMDGWGPQECRRRLTSIVDEILPRAQAWAKEGHLTWLAPNVALRTVIRRDITKAIRLASSTHQPIN